MSSVPNNPHRPVTVTFEAEACDAQALEALLRLRAGRLLSMADLADLLDAAIRLAEAETGGARTPPQDGLLFRTRAAGGQILHSPTLAARIAMHRLERWPLPERWRAHPSEWAVLAAGYCLAHGREPAALEALADLRVAEALLEAWGRQLTCTPGELSHVVRDLAGSGYPLTEEDMPPKKAGAGPTPPLSWSDLPTPP